MIARQRFYAVHAACMIWACAAERTPGRRPTQGLGRAGDAPATRARRPRSQRSWTSPQLSAVDLERLERSYGVHTYTLDAMVVRSKVLEAAGRRDEALALARRAVKDAIAAFGADKHPMSRRLADAQLTHLEGATAGD